MLTKKSLRQEMRLKRKMQAKEVCANLSRQIQAKVLAHPIFQEAKSIALYFAMPGEVATMDLCAKALEQEKAVYLPRVVGSGLMEFVQISRETEFVQSALGILEPLPSYPGYPAWEFTEKFKVELIILPGLAFDRKGSRLGFGGGFYDRFLQTYPQSGRLGLAFAWQIVDLVPKDPWDQNINYLGTEDGVLCL